MKVIEATTLAEAWLRGSEHLARTADWLDFTVLLHVEQPGLVRRADRDVALALDKFLTDRGAFGHHTVAETIFPGYEYRAHGVRGVYEVYPDEIYPAMEPHPDCRWGTYAHRLLRRKGPDGKVYNPLKDCITRMHDKKRKRAAYELGLGFELPLFDDDTDRGSRMGGPCLSHLSFKVMPGDRLQLTALYRLHYYTQRVYGNLLGLARLQEFVAKQADLEVGPLVCHSTMAQLDHQDVCSKPDLRALLASCRRSMDTGAGANPAADGASP